MKKILLLISSFLFLAQPGAADITYRVVHVVDGDTLEATDGNLTFRVRIAGMDAPEWKQRFGKQAANRLRALTSGEKIRIRPVKRLRDKYGRLLGHLFVSEQDVALTLIQEGLATYYRPFCRDYPVDKKYYDYDPLPYIQAEQKAREKSLGIWLAENPQLPCAYRKEHPYKDRRRHPSAFR